MFKKIIALGIAILMSTGLGVVTKGCQRQHEYATDRVQVTINAEYRQKFESKAFAVEDFDWENIDSIQYGVGIESFSRGYISIYLRKHGKVQARAAVRHLNRLSFVETASLCYFATIA
jgi:hypothetical protein